MLGNQILSCRFSAGRFLCHAHLNDVMKRRHSVLPYSRCRSLCGDSTFVATFSASAVMESAISPGSAANRAEIRKWDEYRCLADRYQFERWRSKPRGLGMHISAQTRDNRENRWLCERISIAGIRGSASPVFVIGATPSGG